MVTVSRLTIVNILLSKDDSRIPHAIKTKKKNHKLVKVSVKIKNCDDIIGIIYMNIEHSNEQPNAL